MSDSDCANLAAQTSLPAGFAATLFKKILHYGFSVGYIAGSRKRKIDTKTTLHVC